jgi:hypothetical protein
VRPEELAGVVGRVSVAGSGAEDDKAAGALRLIQKVSNNVGGAGTWGCLQKEPLVHLATEGNELVGGGGQRCMRLKLQWLAGACAHAVEVGVLERACCVVVEAGDGGGVAERERVAVQACACVRGFVVRVSGF